VGFGIVPLIQEKLEKGNQIIKNGLTNTKRKLHILFSFGKENIIEKKIVVDSILRANSIITTIQNMNKPNFSPIVYRNKLAVLNKVAAELDKEESVKEGLVLESMQLDANLMARDDLIVILEEYIELESASIYRMLDEISELQNLANQYQKKLKAFELFAKDDPKFKTIEILKKYNNVISIIQLSNMIGTSTYQTRKILQELIEFGMIDPVDEMGLIHIPQMVEI